jgi:hypothetical protein
MLLPTGRSVKKDLNDSDFTAKAAEKSLVALVSHVGLAFSSQIFLQN